MIFWMNGGNGAAVKRSPVVRSSITPVSRWTATSSPSRMALAAAGHSIEDAGEAVRDDELNTAGLDGDGRVLAGGAAAEVAPRDDDAARFALALEIAVQILHAVGGQLGGIGGVEVAGGDDDVRIDVIAVSDDGRLNEHVRAPPQAWRRGP